MSAELFPIESMAADSPQLAWMRRNAVVAYESLAGRPDSLWFALFWDFAIDFEQLDLASPGNPRDVESLVVLEIGRNGLQRAGTGKTRDEALAELARKFGLKLWNEEEAP